MTYEIEVQALRDELIRTKQQIKELSEKLRQAERAFTASQRCMESLYERSSLLQPFKPPLPESYL